ncbi:sucrose transport protein SUC3-like [Rutidosis leptorrhynchoides]|uniref:sucrose transport protein SUC3-like n=1 Tax=Rutidosis leptorrhynchoides TaxID=125765 RepID=UPI003A9A45B6
MDSVSIRVPYKNLKQHNADAEVELTNFEEESNRRVNEAQNSSRFSNGDASSLPTEDCSLMTLILSCTVAAGVQFGWALQLSLLTPYIQTLGIGHVFSSFIWLCGPITGLVVQPCVGIWSDRCSSKYGRRRPFILVGSLMISIAVIIIGFSADIGYLFGDTKENCSTFKGTRTRAAFVFIIGFWMLDLANNTVQGPARALLADLAGPDQRNSANAIFCSWMAIGNILGFLSGSSGNWHRWFPFLTTRACCEACGNLKAAFLVAVLFLTFCTLVTLYFAKEIPLAPKQHHRLVDSAPLLDDLQQAGLDNSESKDHMNLIDHKVGKSVEGGTLAINGGTTTVHANVEDDRVETFNDSPGAVLVNLLTSLRHLPVGMHSVLIVMALTWLSWFPFFLFDTDWMGREVYHGNPKGDAAEMRAYDQGVREGAFGLLLNSVVLGITSFLIEPMCQRMGSRLVWALSNFVVFACMAGTAIITIISVRQSENSVVGENEAIKNASLVIFAILGLPLAITYSVPFSVTAELTADSGGGQGLAIGVLNLAIVVPQMVVSLGAGPWDALFGGGNVPAFVLASISALAAGVFAAIKLPSLSNTSYKPTGFHFG